MAPSPTFASRIADAALTHTRADFFPTLKLPLVLGRNFAPAEHDVVIVSESLARRLWPGENPLGKLLPFGDDVAGHPIRNTVVGVSRDARFVQLQNPDLAQIYFPANPSDLPGSTLVLRIAADPKGVMAVAAAVLQSIDPKVLPQLRPFLTPFAGS